MLFFFQLIANSKFNGKFDHHISKNSSSGVIGQKIKINPGLPDRRVIISKLVKVMLNEILVI